MIDPSRDILEIQQNNHTISTGTVQPGARLPAHQGYLLNIDPFRESMRKEERKKLDPSPGSNPSTLPPRERRRALLLTPPFTETTAHHPNCC